MNIHDKSNTVIELVSDIPFDELTKPIKLVFENENGTSEVNFKAKNLKPKKFNILLLYSIYWRTNLNFMPCVLPIISIKLLSLPQ